VRSWTGVPVASKDRVIGMLVLAREQPAAYTERHAELAMAIASQAAVAIENARLFTQTERRTRELAALLDVSRSVASTIEMKSLVSTILDKVRTVTDYTGASVAMLEDDELVMIEGRAPYMTDRDGFRFASAVTGT
jgi:GAF domain-containing protein